ncbi:MAG TPA: phosphatase PAP2 family protein [Acidimicrobiales bacterium]|nr:phosphatase PAP2 family protein [Acidimicrobiales bacterium]
MEASAAPPTPEGGAHTIEWGLLCAGLYAVVGSLALWVRGGSSPLRIDRVVSRVVGSSHISRVLADAHLGTVWPQGLGRAVVALGLPVAGIGIAGGLAGMAVLLRDLRAAVVCLVGPAVAVLTTDALLKPLVDRHNGAALAYPSGHATGAAAVATLLLVLFHRWGGWRATAWFAPVAMALPVAMGVALVRLHFHYPTDVLGGTAMGIATVLAVAVLLGAQRPRPLRMSHHAAPRGR